MPKSIIATLICLLTASACFSRVNLEIDTLIPTPKNALINALRVKDSLGIMKRERAVQNGLIDSLYSVLRNCDMENVKWKKLDTVHQQSEQNYKDQLDNMDMQLGVSNDLNALLRSRIKRKNWTIITVAGVSISVIGILTKALLQK